MDSMCGGRRGVQITGQQLFAELPDRVDRLLRWLWQHCGWRRYTSGVATPATLKASIGAAFRAMLHLQQPNGRPVSV